MGGGVTMGRTVEEHIEQVKEFYKNSKEVLLWAFWDRADFGSDLSEEEWASLCDHDFDWSDINEQIETVIAEIKNERPEPKEETTTDDTELWEA
jgi:hypothetical protein